MHKSTPEDRGRKPRKRLFSRFLRDRSGATAIEFAALAIPFSLLVFAILESCIAFAGQEVMANATDEVARQIRTGQLRADAVKAGTPSMVQQLICQRLEIIVAKGCPGLLVDLRNFTDFSDAANAKFAIVNGDIVLMNNGVKDPRGFVVDPGGSESRNMLRVFYKWPVMTDLLAKSMANLNGNATLHFTSITWQNEAYDN
ncbi:TadE/TadG family type IV pilus assembly protein [Mesorhizobium sp. SP-1A]|uniref:TadE/TadG family type IV pilus assembly protein n=1 Tax=Mesorhizobium sp. SP-1A TaxID=3077840 RepID=UPI0028F6CD33|nr:TadE/TadG family type IV pilus assembly protein [Mesorhizobium sp. SP-1A]